MDHTINPPRTAKTRGSRRLALLGLLILITLAGIVYRVVWERQRALDRATISTSDLRVLAIQEPSSADIRILLAERYLMEERNEDALREAKRAAESAPKNAHAFYLLGKAYQRMGESQRALNALTKAVDLDPNHVRARFLLGHGCYWGDQPLLAAQHFAIYVEKQPADDIGFRFLGLSQLRLGKYSPAEAALKRAVELGPESSGNHKALGDLYLARSEGPADLQKAVDAYRRTLELSPGAIDVHMLLGQALDRLDHLPEAAAEYGAYFSVKPTDGKACYALAGIYARLKDPHKAAHYRSIYDRILRAREASSAVNARDAGLPTNPLQ